MQARVRDLTADEFRQRSRQGSLRLRVGPFNVRMRIGLPAAAELVAMLYADCELAAEAEFCHHDLCVRRPRSVRRWVRPYVVFEGDGERPFEPLAADLAFPMLEWGFNWRVAATAHQYLMLHAAVVERNGVTVLMPAMPGSGKSTLAAALMLSGWRLLSDEFGLIRPLSDTFIPFPRPIPLKNESVDVIRSFSAHAVLGPLFRGTRKGDIAHCRPSRESRARDQEGAKVTHVVFPRFEASAETTERTFPKARAFMKLCGNSFNYDVMGAEGFETVGQIVERSECLSFGYGDLDEALRWFERLDGAGTGQQDSAAS